MYLMEAVRGHLKMVLISPKKRPGVMVSKMIGFSCSETTSTTPLLMKNIYNDMKNALTFNKTIQYLPYLANKFWYF